MRFNIFRNPLIDAQVSMLLDTLDDARIRGTENYWRNTISKEIEEYGNRMLENISIDENNIHHGEHMLKYWIEHITTECAKVAKFGGR